MRSAQAVLTCAITIAAAVGAGVLPTDAAAPPAAAVRAPGCASYSTDDSLDLRAWVQSIVVDTSADLHAWTLLPSIAAERVQWSATATQCDSVSARYRAFRMAATGDTGLPLIPVLLLRVGPTRWIADPHVLLRPGLREFIILDSALTVLKLLQTTS